RNDTARFTFGIYAGGLAGPDDGGVPGRPDDPTRIHAALRALQGRAPRFFVRGYTTHRDPAPGWVPQADTPFDLEQYATADRGLELVLMYQSPSGDLDGWLETVRHTVRQRGPGLAKLQIA